MLTTTNRRNNTILQVSDIKFAKSGWLLTKFSHCYTTQSNQLQGKAVLQLSFRTKSAARVGDFPHPYT